MKYHIEYFGRKTVFEDTKPTFGSSSQEGKSILEALTSFIQEQEKNGVKLIKIKIQEDAING